MGEVYLALDTQLDREVALKILAPEIAADQQRLHRFLQEARAASKLKGAHAAHIYDVGESAGTHFIAMEHVEGESLDRLIGGRPMAVGEVLRLGSQVAEALEEAHARSVTHRDVKPANVIVTPRGQAKVLDFGLAKVAGEATADAEAATRVKTSPGVVMGTVAYMSPEQALAERDVDHRTDIYSLGAVLYEMATGRVPFVGESVSKTIDKIVHEQPEAMARFNYDVPAALDLVVRKALRKRRDERYQTAHDLLVDLRALQDELGFTSQQQQQHRSVAPDASGGQTTVTGLTASSGGEQATLMLDGGAQSRVRTTAFAGADTQPAAARTSESPRRRRHPALIAAVAFVAASAVSFAGYLVYHVISVHRHAEEERAPFASLQEMKITKLPSPGLMGTAAISPDGKFIARTVYDGGRISLRLRQVASTGEKEIVPAFEGNIRGVAFARDGDSVYYVAQTDPNVPPELRRVSILGGDSQKIVADVEGAVTLSPDGAQLAFVRFDPKTKEHRLVVADAGGGGERVLAARKPPVYLKNVAWSPDGKLVACVVSGTDKDGYYTNVEGVLVADGSSRSISAARWRNVGSIEWMPDGSGLLLAGRDRASLPSTPEQVWFVPPAGGAARRVTNDTNYYVVLSLTADARTLLAGLRDESGHVWIAPGGDSARARQITPAAGDKPLGIAWTPDGRVVYGVMANDQMDVWIVNADGTGQRQLTSDAALEGGLAVSPDGRHVVFASTRAGAPNIWRMDIDGANARPLTSGNTNDYNPSVSPDGEWVFFESRRAGKASIWKVSIDGGEASRVTERALRVPSVSPDGKLLAAVDETPPTRKLVLLTAAGGEPVREFTLSEETKGMFSTFFPRWTADSRSVCYVDRPDKVTWNVWCQPVGGGKPAPLTNFKSKGIIYFALSPDGRRLALSLNDVTADVILIRDTK